MEPHVPTVDDVVLTEDLAPSTDPTQEAGEREFDPRLAAVECSKGSHNWPNERQAGWCNCQHVYHVLSHNLPEVEKHGKAPSFVMH